VLELEAAALLAVAEVGVANLFKAGGPRAKLGMRCRMWGACRRRGGAIGPAESGGGPRIGRNGGGARMMPAFSGGGAKSGFFVSSAFVTFSCLTLVAAVGVLDVSVVGVLTSVC